MNLDIRCHHVNYKNTLTQIIENSHLGTNKLCSKIQVNMTKHLLEWYLKSPATDLMFKPTSALRITGSQW